MDAQQLIDRLEERAAEVPVGPPPIGLMRTRARRRRQGRVAVLASAAAVAAIAAGLAWPGTGGAGGDSRTPVASEAPGDPDLPPDGYRYVGVGDVVAAVPERWGTNQVDCGTPVADTVVIDQGVTCLALVPRPADVDSLTIRSSFGVGDTAGWTDVEVGGEPALLSPVQVQGDVTRQTVLVPSAQTLFEAESSSADAATVVSRLLDSLTLLRDHTTVPGFQDLAFQRGGRPMMDDYVDRLSRLGLTAKISERNGNGFGSGTVLEVAPGVGSVVAPGDVVRVVAAR